MRNTVQRTQLFAVPDGRISLLSLPPRTFGIHLHKGVQLGIQFLDPREMGFDQFDRDSCFRRICSAMETAERKFSPGMPSQVIAEEKEA